MHNRIEYIIRDCGLGHSVAAGSEPLIQLSLTIESESVTYLHPIDRHVRLSSALHWIPMNCSVQYR